METGPATTSSLSETEKIDQPATPSLVKLLADSSSQRPPYFIVPGGWNFAIFFQWMARNLAGERAGYGLTYPGLLAGGSRFETVEELAQQMVAHVRQVRPTGPYLLVGYSFGGIVGVEMARILEAQGQRVGLVMVDTKLDRLRRPKPRWDRLLIRGRAALEPQRIAHHVRRLTEAIRRSLIPKQRPPMLERVDQVKSATLEAIGRYDPSPCAFPTVLIRAAVPTRGDRYFVDETDYGWSRRLNVVDVLVVAGNHYELHRSAQGKDLAVTVGAALDRLERALGPDATAPGNGKPAS